MEENNYFPTFLKKQRKLMKLSQANFAEFLDIPYNSYQSYELGRMKPSLEVCLDVVERLGLTLNDIYLEPKEEKSTEISVVQAIPFLAERFSKTDPEAFELLAQIQDEHQLTHVRAFLNQLIIQSKQESKKKSS